MCRRILPLALATACLAPAAALAPRAGLVPFNESESIQGQNRPAFLQGLKRVREHHDSGDFDTARSQLQELLAAHVNQPYVTAEFPELDELLHALAFAAQYKTPALGDMIRGEVLAFDEATGDIHLRVDVTSIDKDSDSPGREGPGDLLWSEGRWWCALPFGGPGVLRLRGSVPQLDAPSEGRPTETLYARLSLGEAAKACTSFLVAVAPLADEAEPGVIAYSEEAGDSTPLGQTPEVVLTPGADYELELRVSRRRLFLKNDGGTLLNTMRPKEIYGRFGWVDLPGLAQLEIEGQADREWLNALPELYRAREFELWKREDHGDVGMPAWIPKFLAENPPIVFDAREVERIEQLTELSRQHEWAQLQANLDSTESPAIKPWFQHWFHMQALEGLGRNEEALEHIDEVLALSPQFELAKQVRARLHSKLGTGRLREFYDANQFRDGLDWLNTPEAQRIDEFNALYYAWLFQSGLELISESRTSLARLLELRPEHAGLRRSYSLDLWKRGQWSHALETLQDIADHDQRANQTYVRQLMAVGRREQARTRLQTLAGDLQESSAWLAILDLARRAERTPEFEGAREYEGKDCIIVSRLPEDDCLSAVEEFDGTRKIADHLLGPVHPDHDIHAPIPCYLFHSPEHFDRYRKEVFEDHTELRRGLHNSAFWQAIVQWRLPRASLQTIRHEAAHNQIDRRFCTPPLWFHEGLASYVESRVWTDEGLQPKVSVEHSLERLVPLARGTRDWIPYSELLAFERSEFYHDAGANYSRSLALVHFLLEGTDSELRGHWNDLLANLQSGAAHDVIAQRLIAAIPDIDERVRAHVEGLGLTEKR